MNGNNGNNGNNRHGNHSGWQRVNNRYNPDGSNNGPFGENANGPANGPFGGPQFNGNNGRRNGSHDSIFDLAFYIIGLSVEITFKALEMAFQIIGEVFGSKKNKNVPFRGAQQSNSGGVGNMGQNNRNTYKEEKRAYKEEKREQKAEMRAEKRNSRGNSNTSSEPETQETKLSLFRKDGLLILFLLMTIPLIVLVAMKQVVLAALVLGGGVAAMVCFNIILSALIKSKTKKSKIDEEAAAAEENENAAESDEIEKVMESAFEKVFEIRKDMILIPDGVVKDKIESICAISEKIIGEVRSTPGIYGQNKRFFYYNLDSFNEIFNKYVKLLNYREDSAETNRTLFETEKAFGNIEVIFKEILTKVLERDLINLQAEINVMNNSQ